MAPGLVCQKPGSDLEALLSASVCVLQNVTPKDESVFDEKVSSKDTLPSHTLGMFKHDFGDNGKIKDTWFIRQFSKDEAARKVRLSGRHSQNVTVLLVFVSNTSACLKHSHDCVISSLCCERFPAVLPSQGSKMSQQRYQRDIHS